MKYEMTEYRYSVNNVLKQLKKQHDRYTERAENTDDLHERLLYLISKYAYEDCLNIIRKDCAFKGGFDELMWYIEKLEEQERETEGE